MLMPTSTSTLLSMCQFYYPNMLFRIYLLSFLLHFTSSRVNKHLKISCGLDEVSRDSVAMTFYVKIGNTGEECMVECIPGRCCSEQGDEENCDVIKLFGGYLHNIPAGESRTVRLAAPLVDPFERRGYCIVHVNSKLKDNAIYRDSIIIPFDTGKAADVTPCAGVDLDALNNCQPVDCETYYNGQKTHFSKRLKRCLAAPQCSEDDIYDENLNRCVTRISDDDIKEIASLSNRKITNSVINTTNLNSLDTNDLDNTQKIIENCEGNKIGLSFYDILKSVVLVGVICLQCCFLVLSTYCYRTRCHGVGQDKEVYKRYFNNRGASISTPLLSDSGGTATTYQIQTESSFDIDKKIKFYKACQDKRAKASMSDDILSRCLKRRDWTTNPKSSEAIPKGRNEDIGIEMHERISDRIAKSKECITTKTSEKNVNTDEYEPHNFYEKYVTALKKTHSLNDKCAKQGVSKDSIDFLSERGTQSDLSSNGTSKNNLETVLSLLSQKMEAVSDPDLELLHMSRASVFSSDGSDYDTRSVGGI